MVQIRLLLSIVLAIVAYFLGIVAEATHESDSAIYMASCFIKILCYLIAVPLAYSAGMIIRRELDIIGAPGLRFVAWIMFGVAIIHFMTFFIWTAPTWDGSLLPDGQITINSAIFFISSMLMIAESWN
jgi:hypothetical protein